MVEHVHHASDQKPQDGSVNDEKERGSVAELQAVHKLEQNQKKRAGFHSGFSFT
ncbi:hypothetical protein PI125_g23582 [Phytophthora idaei]|nr:hypothetical protein PI125_g23582 [Phytophthora idaei]